MRKKNTLIPDASCLMLVLYLYATVCLLVGVSESGRSGMEAEISHDPSLSVLQYSVFLLVVIVDSAGNCLSHPRGEPPRSCSVPLKCDYKKKKKTGLSALNTFILSSSSLFVLALCFSAPGLTRPIYTLTSAAV